MSNDEVDVRIPVPPERANLIQMLEEALCLARDSTETLERVGYIARKVADAAGPQPISAKGMNRFVKYIKDRGLEIDGDILALTMQVIKSALSKDPHYIHHMIALHDTVCEHLDSLGVDSDEDDEDEPTDLN